MEAERDVRRDVGKIPLKGGPGGGRLVPGAGASPRRPLSPQRTPENRLAPQRSLPVSSGPGSSAHSHRGGTDGTVAGWGHGPGCNGLGARRRVTLTRVYLPQGRGRRAPMSIYSRLLQERICQCVMGPVSASRAAILPAVCPDLRKPP